MGDIKKRVEETIDYLFRQNDYAKKDIERIEKCLRNLDIGVTSRGLETICRDLKTRETEIQRYEEEIAMLRFLLQDEDEEKKGELREEDLVCPQCFARIGSNHKMTCTYGKGVVVICKICGRHPNSKHHRDFCMQHVKIERQI